MYRYLRLRLSDKWLLAQAALLLMLVRAGLSLLPLGTVVRLVSNADRTRDRLGEADWALIRRVVWAIRTVRNHGGGGGSCLAQALAAQVLLGRRRQPSRLRIGVRMMQGKLEAHAWLESEGRIVFGELNDGGGRYIPLTSAKELRL